MDKSVKWTLKPKTNPSKFGTYIYEKKSDDNPIIEPVADHHVSPIIRNEFEVFLDAGDYNADEITVETNDDLLIVRGKKGKSGEHETPDHFERYFRFERHFPLEDVNSIIVEDGILKIQTLEPYEAVADVNNG